MTCSRVPAGFLLAVAVSCLGAPRAIAQESGKTKDSALDSLIEELAKPQSTDSAKRAAQDESKQATKSSPRRARVGAKSAGTQKTGEKAPSGGSQKATGKKSGSGAVDSKDQELDSLLEKLGESKETPTAEGRPATPGGADEPRKEAGAKKPAQPKLAGQDKDIDERLEEYTGRRKKRPASDEQRSGPVGEIIKEMRDVEQRLGKPDTGDDTQNRQKQIVKRIETLIEQIRQSGGSAMGFRIRRIRQPGQQGQQPGDQTGALARGAPPTRPLKPTGQHSNAGSKEVWGHLPPELQQVMENSFKEAQLATKAELIDRYFLSVSKGKLVREE